ncbi:class I SAM-dependent methyltransferase [Marinivivus vitaminiproducens]|uniref:class I SAM-dependent methyltransferase n=1 Tax=Marinivivus vitaminiproducens TaxID=3035935 RepID=UPI0027A924D2|nr:phospholipid methyltransferase [Geminicoccaceae bacterium SCSIO 64248]
MTPSSTTTKENELFFRHWLRKPKEMGSITPSSPFLARAIADVVAARTRPTLVELGGGTGPITQGLLRAGVPSEKLVVIELEPHLHAYMQRRFPNLRVILGDATRLTDILAEHGIDDVGAVVSGIPMVNMPPEFQRAIVSQAFNVLPDDGFLVQYSYSPVPPIKHKALGLEAKRMKYVLRNIPPAAVWRFSRGAEFVPLTVEKAKADAQATAA